MPIPRFRIRTLMIAVAVVGIVFAAMAALATHLRTEAEYKMVLRDNYWLQIEVSPLGWLLLAMCVLVVIGTAMAIMRALRRY